ncbi:MAG TPA: hypothetical protein VHB98_07355, partial [Chloroflexota bacterium]|nr:hypothetical protein [Chloroflexota bacterium]
FLPEIAVDMAPDEITMMDPQGLVDPPQGEMRTADVAAQVRDLRGRPQTVLLHTEVQTDPGGEFGFRMWQYNATLTNRYGPPVVSIALLPFVRGGIRLVRYTETAFGRNYTKLEYWRIGLRSLKAADYARTGPALGAVLAALMQHGAESMVDIRTTAAERVEDSDLDPYRERILIDFVQAYMPLSPREYAEYLRRITPGGTTMETIEKTWSQKILEQGLEQGALQARREVLEQLILARFGSVPSPLADRIATADRETLDRLLNRVALASSIDEFDEEPA